MKKKLSLHEQIAHMENKGITFKLISKESAIDYLQNHNYYFRIKSYAKNYEKYSSTSKQGNYINLDFEYLKEISILDLYLRRILLRMTLDIEHVLKVTFLNFVLQSTDENGYNVVKEFFATSEGNKILQGLNKLNDFYCTANTRSYSSNIVKKYHPNYPL